MLLPGRPPNSERGRRAGGPVVLLIGSREMPVQCADLLIAHGCDIAATHSPDEPLREWALAHQQLHIADFEEFREWGEMIGCDYLFSVVNFRILPTSLIQSPAVFAINYHDSLLPKYAGSHACAWALHNRETFHGVSWHVMTDKVDGGDLLAQASFPIESDDTVARLHHKCRLAGLAAFRALLHDLKAGTFTRTPQDFAHRTFYRRCARPNV